MKNIDSLRSRPWTILHLFFWIIADVTGKNVAEQTFWNPSLTDNCSTSYLAANELVDGDVFISAYDTLSNNEFPKMTTLNSSAWELWYFDAVSPSGDVGITISFFRDGSQSLMGKGSLRTQFHALWSDGSTFGTENYASNSTIDSCPEAIKAFWRAEHESTSFEISQDLKETVVRFDLAAVQGTLSLLSVSQTFLADHEADPSAEASWRLAPTIYWLQEIPRASVEATFTIEGKELNFTGFGGHDRFWTPYSWMTLMDGSYYMRATAGPYTLVMLRIISRVDSGRIYVSVCLFEEGQRVFATRTERISLNDEFVSFKLSYHGTLQGKFKDTNTGYVLDLVSPVKKKHWRFELNHESLWWDLPTGPVTGNTGFIDRVTRGEVDGEQYQGAGGAGQCQLPSLKK